MGDKSGGGKGIKIEPAKDYEKMIKLQLRYLPKQLQAEYANRAMWDPKLIEQAMGLQEQYDPRLAQEQFDALQRRDPQWVASHQLFGDRVKQALERGFIDPTRMHAYQALGEQVTGDTLRGATADPETLRQMTQSILSRSPSLSYGEAQDMAAAVFTGQRGQQLKSQRQQATNQFLGQQSESDLALTAGGRYMGTPGMVQMENQIGGVQAPRAFGYVNPQAGPQGLQLGLQNQQAQLYNQSQGGGSNPWTNALQGVSTGASYGSIGGGYGAAGGAIVGGVAGALGYPQYSDIRTKRDIVKIGEYKGLDVIEFRYWKGRIRFRGLIAQQVQQKYPDAVGIRDGFLTVDYDKIGLPMTKCCKHCHQFKPLTDFRATKNKIDGRRGECRVCGKAYKKRWARENRDKYLTACNRTSSRAWLKINADPVRHAKMRATQNRLRKTPKWRAKINAARKRAWWKNINFRLRMCLSHRVGNAIRRQKATKPTVSLLGCSLDEFKRHIQKQFREGMAWNNYGKWHIDHIRPCMSFDLLDPKQQKECFHFTNMQPLWATENLVKGNKQRSLSKLGVP